MSTRTSLPLRGRRRGSIVVETAIVLPIFMMLFLGAFEYCRFLMVRNLVDHAVAEGARFAVVHTYDMTTADIQKKVLDQLAGQEGQLGNPPTIQVFKCDPTTGASLDLWTNAAFGDSIMVQVTGTYRPALPSFLLMTSTITVKSQSMMRCEAN